MILAAIEKQGIAHLSYLIADEQKGVAAVIDPRRDIAIYLDVARRHAVAITHILETHVQEDFVSGSRELAKNDELDKNRPVATDCATGYRGSIAACLLQRHGFQQVFNVPGSMKAWQAAGYPRQQ